MRQVLLVASAVIAAQLAGCAPATIEAGWDDLAVPLRSEAVVTPNNGTNIEVSAAYTFTPYSTGVKEGPVQVDGIVDVDDTGLTKRAVFDPSSGEPLSDCDFVSLVWEVRSQYNSWGRWKQGIETDQVAYRVGSQPRIELTLFADNVQTVVSVNGGPGVQHTYDDMYIVDSSLHLIGGEVRLANDAVLKEDILVELYQEWSSGTSGSVSPTLLTIPAGANGVGFAVNVNQADSDAPHCLKSTGGSSFDGGPTSGTSTSSTTDVRVLNLRGVARYCGAIKQEHSITLCVRVPKG